MTWATRWAALDSLACDQGFSLVRLSRAIDLDSYAGGRADPCDVWPPPDDSGFRSQSTSCTRGGTRSGFRRAGSPQTSRRTMRCLQHLDGLGERSRHVVSMPETARGA